LAIASIKRPGGLRGKLHWTVALPLLTLLLLLLPAHRATAQSSPVQGSDAKLVSAYEVRLVEAINDVREDHGLRRLRLARGLMRSSGSHSLQMANRGYFSHSSWNGTSFFTRIKSYFSCAHARYFSAGENMLWARPRIGPRQIVKRWLASPRHRAVLLTRQWRLLGVGVVKTPHGPGVFQGRAVLLVTADFVVKR
jgi:uncharacterized protein YkwD